MGLLIQIYHRQEMISPIMKIDEAHAYYPCARILLNHCHLNSLVWIRSNFAWTMFARSILGIHCPFISFNSFLEYSPSK